MSYLAVTHNTSPYVTVYNFNGGQIGTKITDPGSAIAGNGRGVKWGNGYIFIGHQTTPFISAYPFTTGFGTKVTDPATVPTGNSSDIAVRGNATDVAVASGSTSPYVTAYPFTSSFGTKYADPGTPPGEGQRAIAFSPDNSYIGTTGLNSQYGIYAFSGSGFGTKATNPGSTGTHGGIRWSPSGSYIAFSGDNSPYINVYAWSGSIGTKATDPGSLPGTGGRHAAWTPDSGHVAVVHDTSPYVYVYPFTTAFGTKMTDPSSLAADKSEGVAFSPQGKFIGTAGMNITSPYMTIWPWSASGFGTKLSNPGIAPTGNAQDMDWRNAAPTISAQPTTTYSVGTRVGPVNTWGVTFTPSDTDDTGTNGLNYEVRTSATPAAGTLITSGTCTHSTSKVITGLAYNITGLVSGDNVLYVHVTDGFETAVSSSFTVKVDPSVSAPSVDSYSPTPVDGTKQYSVQFDAQDTYSTSTNEMTYQIRTSSGGAGSLVGSGSFTQGLNVVTSIHNDSGLVEGNNNRYMRVFDGANNVNEVVFVVVLVSGQPSARRLQGRYFRPVEIGRSGTIIS